MGLGVVPSQWEVTVYKTICVSGSKVEVDTAVRAASFTS